MDEKVVGWGEEDNGNTFGLLLPHALVIDYVLCPSYPPTVCAIGAEAERWSEMGQRCCLELRCGAVVRGRGARGCAEVRWHLILFAWSRDSKERNWTWIMNLDLARRFVDLNKTPPIS